MINIFQEIIRVSDNDKREEEDNECGRSKLRILKQNNGTGHIFTYKVDK